MVPSATLCTLSKALEELDYFIDSAFVNSHTNRG
jgi:hypothetical protein